MGLRENLYHLHRWILISLVLCIPVCSGRIRPRAVPVYSHQDQTKFLSEIIKSPPSELPFDLDLCPWGQVGHTKGNASVCCLPISCQPGFSIQVCDGNGKSDKCVPCGINMIQPNHVSSFNMEEAQCFLKDSQHDHCYDSEENPSPIFRGFECRKLCQCKWADCFFMDSNCYCDKSKVCDPGFTMDWRKGGCVPCPFGTYKNVTGCTPCLVNQTLLRLGKPGKLNVSSKLEPTTSPQPPVITTQEKVEMATEVTVDQTVQLTTVEKLPVWAVIVVVFLAVLMLCLTAHILICRVQVLREKLSCFCFYRCVSLNRLGTGHVTAQLLNRQQGQGNHGNENDRQDVAGGCNGVEEVIAQGGNDVWNIDRIGGREDMSQDRGQVHGQGQQRCHRARGDPRQRHCQDDDINVSAPVHQPLLGREAGQTGERSPIVSEALELARALNASTGMQGNTFISDSTFIGCTFNGSVVKNGRNGSDSSNPSSPVPSLQPEKLTVNLSSKKPDEMKQDPNPEPSNFVTQETGASGDSKIVTGHVDRPWVVPDFSGGRPDPWLQQPAGSDGYRAVAGQESLSEEGGHATQSPHMRSPNAAGAHGVNVPHTPAHQSVAMSNLKNGSVEKPQAVIRPMQQQRQSFVSGARRQTMNDSDNPLSHSIPSYVMPLPQHGSVAQDSLSSDLNALGNERSNFNHSNGPSGTARNVYSQRPCADGISLYHSSSHEDPVCANRPDYQHQTEVKQVFGVNTDNTEVKVVEGEVHRSDNHQVSRVIGKPDREGKLRLPSGEVVERVVEGQSFDTNERLAMPTFVSLGSSGSSFELDTQQVQNALADGGGVSGGSDKGGANVAGDGPVNDDSYELPLVPIRETLRGNGDDSYELPVVPTSEAVCDDRADSDASVELPLNLDMH